MSLTDDILIPEDIEEDEDESPKMKENSEIETENKNTISQNYTQAALTDMVEKFLLKFSKEVSVFDKTTKTSKKERRHKYATEIAMFPKIVKVKRHYIIENSKKVSEDIPASYIVIAYEDLELYTNIIDTKEGSILIQLIEENPDLFLTCARTAVGKILHEVDPVYYEFIKYNIDVGISDYVKSKEIPELSVKDEGKLIYMDGLVTSKDGSVVPKILTKAWECKKGHVVETDPDLKSLRKCTVENCGEAILRESKRHASKIDTVGFTLQQKNEKAIEGYSQNLECQIIGHEKSQMFLNDIIPGNAITLDGILRIEYVQGKNRIETTKFLEVVSFRKQKDSELFRKDDMIADLVKQIPQDPISYYNKVVDSIAPHIFGRKYKIIKEAVLMVLIGNLAKKDFTGSRYKGNLALLLVGSPSTAKSEFLRDAESLDPKAQYASSLSSKAGFTVSALLTEDTRRLTHGIIPLANGGTALIDESDKLDPEAYKAMIECMDDNEILNYNKAEFHAKINTRCGHIHACNSNKNNGDYNPYLPFYEQVELPAALISRYDLIFVVQGLDDDEDNELIKHFEKLDATLMSENEYSTGNIMKNAMDSTNMDVFDKKYMIHLRDYLRNIPPSKRPKLKAGSPAWHMLQTFIMKYKRAKHLRFLDDPESAANPDLIDLRKRRTGRNIAEIIALIMRDSDQVEVHHMERALLLMETSLASLIPKTREASEDDLMNTKSRAMQKNPLDKLTGMARKQVLDNLKIMGDKRKAVKDVIHQLAKQTCPSCRGRGKRIETDGFNGNTAYPCKECKTKGWYYESVSHNELISYIVDQGKSRIVIYQKELEAIIKEYLEIEAVNFIKIDKNLGGNSIRYRPTLDLTGVQATIMIEQYVDPYNALESKIRQSEHDEQHQQGDSEDRGPNVLGVSKSAEQNMKSVNRELKKMGVDIKTVDSRESLEEVLDDRGIPVRKGSRTDVGNL